MKYLFERWDAISERMRFRQLFLFLDYDGTLTPIAEAPKKAVMSKETREALERLLKIPGCELAIISGRSIRDIKNMVGLRGIIYSGNHGLEIEGPKIKFKSPVPANYAACLGAIKEQLAQGLNSIDGYIIEDKGLSLALHYRRVNKKDIPLLKTVFYEAVLPYRNKDRVKVGAGKMVLEVRPPIEWDKGKVVLWLLARQKFALKDKFVLPVYIGDDRTDEDVFSALKGEGVTVFVGKPDVYSADYYLKDTDEVTRILEKIAELKNSRYERTDKGQRAV